MKKNIFLILILFVSLSLFATGETVSNDEKILIKKIKISSSFGVKKINVKYKLIDTYSKLIIESSDNEVKFGTIRLFFKNGSEQNIKGGKGTLVVNPEQPIEKEITNPNKIKKMTFYYSNSRDKEKYTYLSVYLIK